MNAAPFKISLAAARVNAGYTQPEVASKLGVNVNTIVSWEKDNSKLGIKRIHQFSKLYKVPSDNIFFGNKYEFIRMMQSQ